MKTQITTSTITCDICKDSIPESDLMVRDEMRYYVRSLEYEVYYGGLKSIKDVCNKCNTRIFNLIFDLMTKK